jgi:DNA repair exonuclease SbcCD ATPase subunit
MADLILRRLVLKNWACFQDVNIEFPSSGGLILVQGVNTASDGALMSVGSGKTCFGEAISRTLFDVPGRFSALKQYSTNKNGNTYVAVHAVYRGKPLLVEAGYKYKALNKTGEALRFTYADKQIECGTLQQTRQELQRLLQIPPLLASWTIHIDGDVIRFNQLSQADCVALVMGSLNQPPWDEYYEISKKSLGQFRQTLTESKYKCTASENTVQNLEKQLEQARQDLELAKKRYAEQCASVENQKNKIIHAINEISKAVAEIETKKNELRRKIKSMEADSAEEIHTLEIKIKDIQENLNAAETELNKIRQTGRRAELDLSKHKLEYEQYTKKQPNCPVCGRPMPKPDPAKLAELQQRLEASQKIKAQTDSEEIAAATGLNALREQLKTATAKLLALSKNSQIKELSEQYEHCESEISQKEKILQQYKKQLAELEKPVSTSEVDIAQARYLDRAKDLETAKKTLAEDRARLEGDLQTVTVLEYVNQAFSPYGIPNMILQEAIAPLNHAARCISHALTGGTIEIRYSTIRELASGKDKAQLHIEVVNALGDKDLRGSSKGESGLVNFIIAETLASIGQITSKVNYRWYDEIVPHQDSRVAQSIYSYARDLAHKQNVLIFLVDHNPLAANYADRILRIEKIKKNENGNPLIYSVASWDTPVQTTN